MTIAASAPMSAGQIAADLAQVPVFRAISASAAQELARAARIVAKSKGDFIIHGDEMPQAFFHVLSGQVKIGITSDQGEDKIIEICSRGESFGLAGLFSTVRHFSFAQATAATRLLRVGKEGVMAALAREPRLYDSIATALANRSLALERDLAAFCTHSARRRVLDYFLHQAEPKAESSRTVVTLDVRKRLIAARLSLTPETFSRALRDLSEAGLISVRGRQVTLEEALMARLATAARPAAAAASGAAKNRRRSDAIAEPVPPARPINTRAWI